MRLTRFGFQGLLFYLVMLGAFFAAPYSNLFFLLLGFLTLVGMIGGLAAVKNLRGVTASLVELPPVPSQTGIQVPMQLQAKRPPRFQIAAQLQLAGGRELRGVVDLLDGNASLSLHAEGLARGGYAIEGACIDSSYPFGILRVQRAFQAPDELIVYPAPEGMLEGRSMAETLDELLGPGDPGVEDLQPSSLRDHREGEGVRGIHWRASARRGRLVVQEWEGGSGQGLEVVLDRRCPADQLEHALATLSAMVHVARTNKETLRIHSQELSATFGEGQRPWPEALRFLAMAEALPEGALAPPSTSPAVARLPRAHALQGEQ